MEQASVVPLTAILDEARKLIEQLLAASVSCDTAHIPTSQGVYLIYDKAGQVIYVGKGKNLNRRIVLDHLGADLKMSTSTFRRSVSKVYEMSAGQAVKNWILKNCSFAFVAVPDPDLCSVVEEATVLLLRRQGCKLLNA